MLLSTLMMILLVGGQRLQDPSSAVPASAASSPSSGQAQPAQAVVEQAVIRAVGIGRPPEGKTGPQATLMARRAAEVVALRNLAAMVEGQHVSQSPGGEITATTKGFIAGYTLLPPRTLPDGTVEVAVELPVMRVYESFRSQSQQAAALEAGLKQAHSELTQTQQSLKVAETALKDAQAQLSAATVAWQQTRSDLDTAGALLQESQAQRDAARVEAERSAAAVKALVDWARTLIADLERTKSRAEELLKNLPSSEG